MAGYRNQARNFWIGICSYSSTIYWKDYDLTPLRILGNHASSHIIQKVYIYFRILSSTSLIYIYSFVCVCVFAYVCMHMHIQMPAEVRRGCQILRSWSYRQLWDTWYGCWEPNPGALQEQVLLTAKSSLYPLSPHCDFNRPPDLNPTDSIKEVLFRL